MTPAFLALTPVPRSVLLLVALALAGPMGGAQVTRLNGTLVSGGNVTGFVISPDGQRVVYLADAEEDQRFELYSAPRSGATAAVKLNPTLLAGTDVDRFAIAPDGARVVFTVSGPGAGQLYSVPLAGGTALRLDPISLDRLQIELDGIRGGRVAFTVTDDVVGSAENARNLYSAPLDGSAPAVRLNNALGGHTSNPVENTFGVSATRLHPDGARIGFTLAHMTSQNGTWIAPLDGSAPALKVVGTTRLFWELTADHLIQHDYPNSGNLSSRRLDLTQPLTQIAPGISALPFPDLVIHPVTGEVVFLGFPSAQSRLVSAVPGGERAPWILDAAPAGLSVRDTSLTPSGGDAAYVADAGPGFPTRLFTLRWPSGGAGPRYRASEPRVAEIGALLPPAIEPLDAAGSFLIAPDGKNVVFKAVTSGSVVELYGARTRGRTPPVRLNGTLVPGGNVLASASGATASELRPRISSDGQRVVYAADQETDEVLELFEAPIDGHRAPTRVNAPLVTGGDALSSLGRPAFELTPDDGAVVYLADGNTDGVVELWVSELPALP